MLLGFILRRAIYIVPILILVSILSFIIILAPPGDFLTAQFEQLYQQYGDGAEERINILRKRYKLDQPVHMQYFKWVTGIITKGDFGFSFLTNQAVTDIIKSRLPMTILITFLTLLFTWILAVPIGVYSAIKQYTIFDYIFTFIAFIGKSVPNFLLALILMFIFYESFGWSLGGLFSQEFQRAPWSIGKMLDLGKHLLLPIVVVGTAGTADVVRTLRSMMLDELNKEYVQTARAKGLSERIVIWKHVFKIAILPSISTIGWLLPQLVSGAMITSIVINLPTTGATMLEALKNQDMFVAGSFVLILSTLTIIGTLVSDIMLAWIDPRIRYN